jgi:3-methyladenine DNA glycosylase AlkD
MILAGPLWAKGRLSDRLVETWSKSPDRWLRRSALVATVGLNARTSGGPGDAGRTLPICRRLAADRDDMVEKAMSWALRVLSQRDRPAVEAFMAEMDERLPARVRREVRHKLATGLKSGRNRNMVTGA